MVRVRSKINVMTVIVVLPLLFCVQICFFGLLLFVVLYNV